MPLTIAERTRRVYDAVSGVYPASTFFFHSKAHRAALRHSGIQNGMRILEVATGSGEMFRRLVRANPDGQTIGLDLSPKMAAHTLRRGRKEVRHASILCGAVDVRELPFEEAAFDAIVCCFLLELLSHQDIRRTLREIRRVLRPGGTFTLTVIGQNVSFFNGMYSVAGGLVPAFWGRQVEAEVPRMIAEVGLSIEVDQFLRQGFYPSRVLVSRR